MANLGKQFKADDHGEMRVFGALPEGDYLCVIAESDMKPTRNEKGEYLELVFDVLTPEYSGRKLYTRLNINNPSQQAMEIANNELGTICKAVGKPVIQDSVELHGIPLIVSVRVTAAKAAVEGTSTTKARKARPESNENTGYSPADGSAIPANAGSGVAQPSDPSQHVHKSQKDAATLASDDASLAADAVEKPPWG